MKKSLFNALLILTVSSGSAIAQCVPDPSLTDPGIYPDTVTNLPVGTAGVFYSTDIQLKVLEDTSAGALTVIVDNITIDSVSGLPGGFSYACTPGTCVFPGGSNSCIRLSGTNATPGTYPLNVYVTLNGSLFGFPVSFPAVVAGYRIQLDVATTPTAQFIASATTICEDQVITFTDQSTNNPTSWSWSFPGGILPTSTDQNPEVLYDTPGTYDVSLTVTNAAGSSTVVETSLIVVNAKPLAKITPTGIVDLCAGQSTVLSANIGAGLTYQWFRYGNLLVGETNQTLTTQAGGDYKVKVTDSNNGCTKRSGWRTVQINPLPAVTIQSQGPTTICKNEVAVLEATTNPNNTYQWTAGGVDIPGAINSTYGATVSEYYRVRATDPNGCSKLSPGIVIIVQKLPDNQITASGPLTFCAGDSVVLSANPVVGNTFQWELNFSAIPGETDPDYTAFSSGKYTFTVTGANGCSRRSAVRKVDVNCRLANPELALEKDLSVYPNPAGEKATIEAVIPETSVTGIAMYDISGRQVLDFGVTEREAGIYNIELDTENILPGIYMVRMWDETQSKTVRLVIQK